MKVASSNREKSTLPILTFLAIVSVASGSLCLGQSLSVSGKRVETTQIISAVGKGKINGKIVFTSNRNRNLSSLGLRLWTMNPDGSNPTELTNEQIPTPPQSSLLDDTGPKWSPDGARIAFLSSRDFVDVDHDPSPYTIYIMDANSGNLQRVTLDHLLTVSPVNCTEIYSFEWSPDGSRFALSAGNLVSGIGGCANSPSAEIYSVKADGTNLVKLTQDTKPSTLTYFMNTSPTWSPDGSKIAFVSWNENGDGANTIEVMDADGSNRRQIAHYGYQDLIKGVSWSPDGSKILFDGPPNYGTCVNYICSEVYTIKPDGSGLTQLTHYPASYSGSSGPRWSPDGTKIVFERRLLDPYSHQITTFEAIFVMDADGSNQVNISNRADLQQLDAQSDWQPLLNPANDPPPSVLGFSSGVYLARYPDPSTVQIVVMRTGNLDQTVSCDYQIRSGAVMAGLPGGTFTFGPHEASKSIQFSYSYSSYLAYAFNVSLYNNAGNATFVGGLKDATIIFAGQNQNPINNSAYFIQQQYHDFLNREPDQSGWEFWNNNIDGVCGTGDTGSSCRAAKRVDTSAAFFLSIEFQQTGYLVYRTYKAAYGNLPNAPVPIRLNEFLPDTQQIGQGVVVGQSGWDQALESNKQNFMTSYVQGSRFTSAFPTSMSAQQFVDTLYTNAGLVPSSAPNRAQAINEFNSTTPADPAARARALRDVAEDPMLTQQEFNRAFVLMQYFGYLRRDPNSGPDTDFSGYDFWLNKLNQFNGNYIDAELVKAFINSTEYRSRFGPP